MSPQVGLVTRDPEDALLIGSKILTSLLTPKSAASRDRCELTAPTVPVDQDLLSSRTGLTPSAPQAAEIESPSAAIWMRRVLLADDPLALAAMTIARVESSAVARSNFGTTLTRPRVIELLDFIPALSHESLMEEGGR
jgi:hypothetical protein